mmetsp:Transcript_20905/g.52830  ORF Transcript_20905/g.52830 Transcript_20905/m.52830 type:complete len:214 (-) Transcript_20905:254-895(-)
MPSASNVFSETVTHSGPGGFAALIISASPAPCSCVNCASAFGAGALWETANRGDGSQFVLQKWLLSTALPGSMNRADWGAMHWLLSETPAAITSQSRAEWTSIVWPKYTGAHLLVVTSIVQQPQLQSGLSRWPMPSSERRFCVRINGNEMCCAALGRPTSKRSATCPCAAVRVLRATLIAPTHAGAVDVSDHNHDPSTNRVATAPRRAPGASP